MDVSERSVLLAQNQLIRARNRPDQPIYRIVWTGRDSATTFLARIDGQGEWLIHLETRILQQRLVPDYTQSDAVEFVDSKEDPYADAVAEVPPRAQTRHQHIKDLVTGDNLFRIVAGIGRTALYKEFATRAKTTRQTIASWVKLYLTRGMHAAALDGDAKNSGAPGRPRTSERKLGRPRTITPGIGTQPDAKGLEMLSAGYVYWKGNSGRTYQQVKEFIDQHYCRDWAPEDRFTTGQIRYYIWKQDNYRARRVRKVGALRFKLKERAYYGKSTVYGPGAEFQIDSTVADVYLVSELNRLQVVGRPIIYIVTDTFSRLIVGFYVGFENPSIMGAALVMESVATTKSELCRIFDIGVTDDNWPAHHLPARILHDRGKEFMSALAWARLKMRYGVDFDCAPPFRPDWKAIVESRFGILTRDWSSYVPGHVEKDYLERDAWDYKLDAKLTLSEFRCVFACFTHKYNMRPLKNIDHLPEMVAQGIPPTPVELWKFGVQHYSGVLRAEPVEAVRACVYPRAMARVTKEGIEFDGRCYETPRAVQEQWFSRARAFDTWEVEVACDPSAPAKTLYVVHADGGFERATTRQTGAQYDMNVSMAEVKLFKESVARNIAKSQHDLANANLDVLDRVEAVIEEGIAATDKAKERAGVAKVSTKDMRSAREKEREYERQQRGAADSTPAHNEAPGLHTPPPAPRSSGWDDEGVCEAQLDAIQARRNEVQSGGR